MVGEGGVNPVDTAHDHRPLQGRQRRRGREIGRSVALHAVDGDAQFVFQGVARIEEHAEHADRTREGHLVGHDRIGRAGDVITAAGCIGAHRHDDGFLGTQQFDLAPDDVRCQRASAGGVDAQHDGLHLLVVAHAGDLRGQRIAVNLLAVPLAVDDLTVGIDDGHLVGGDVFQVGAHLRGVVAQRDEVVIVGNAQFGKDILHLVLVDQTVDKPFFKRLAGKRHLQSVGHFVQRLQFDAARLGDAFGDDAPHRADELLHLFAVGVGHLVIDIRFDGALVFAGRGAEHFGLEVEFVQQPLVEHQVHRQSGPLHHALGLHVDLVGDRSQVIAALRIGFVVGDDEFAALLELHERLAQLLQDRRTGYAPRAVHPQVDALDAVVVTRGFEGAERLQERKLPLGLERHQVETRQRIGRRGVGQHLREVDLQDRLGMHRHTFLHRAGNAQQNENPKEKHQERPHDDREKPCQKSLDKIHSSLYFIVVFFRMLSQI